MSTLQTKRMSVEAMKNLFEDCLTRGEQQQIAQRFNSTLESLFVQNDSEDIYYEMMKYLRG